MISISAIDRQLADSIGENLDALLVLDPRGYGVGRILYESARKQTQEPLTTSAARALTGVVGAKDVVVIGTGFVFPPYNKGELDGVVGTAVLARTLERCLGVVPVIAVEPELVESVRPLLRTAGLNVYDSPEYALRLPHASMVVPFPKDEAEAAMVAAEVIGTFAPKAVISIERPGRNVHGIYHMGNGTDVTALAAKFDVLFVEARRQGILTLAIGDLGNELGMGGLIDTVHARIPYGATCQCPCGGGLAAAVAADHVVVASVSDWGAYGLSAAIAHLSDHPEVLTSGHELSELFKTAVASGLIDGSGYAIPAVDGVLVDANARLIDQIADMVRYPRAGALHYRGMYEQLLALAQPTV